MAHPTAAELGVITIEIKYGIKFEYILLRKYNSELYMTATELTEKGGSLVIRVERL